MQPRLVIKYGGPSSAASEHLLPEIYGLASLDWTAAYLDATLVNRASSPRHADADADADRLRVELSAFEAERRGCVLKLGTATARGETTSLRYDGEGRRFWLAPERITDAGQWGSQGPKPAGLVEPMDTPEHSSGGEEEEQQPESETSRKDEPSGVGFPDHGARDDSNAETFDSGPSSLWPSWPATAVSRVLTKRSSRENVGSDGQLGSEGDVSSHESARNDRHVKRREEFRLFENFDADAKALRELIEERSVSLSRSMPKVKPRAVHAIIGLLGIFLGLLLSIIGLSFVLILELSRETLVQLQMIFFVLFLLCLVITAAAIVFTLQIAPAERILLGI
ncbi:hypothetical protein AYO20_08407 [Fonsecaea nubica]|uniref:Uncharacterized protein n=1 Tax=Fonsecaea nubica TaxID=856822 RepID=A0A178CNS6_9EURO|nr:hypothetical protein AYO20_08407 [Fonsecaea nubica]OAL31076.1 hypothetical protein AYO20_08407 [Fonsecaea nubica]